MLHIILFILKLIGFIIAIILGILLFLILIVLFVPIRYKVEAEKKETFKLDAKVSWLLRVLYFRITLVENQLVMRLRILGRVFYDSNTVKIKDIDNEKKEKVKKTLKVKKTKKTKKIKKAKSKSEQTNLSEADNIKLIDETVIEKRVDKEYINDDHVNNSYVSDKHDKENKEEEFIKENLIRNNNEVEHEEVEHEEDELGNEKRSGFLVKLKRICFWFINIPQKIKNFFLSIWNSIIGIKNKLKKFADFWSNLKDFLQNEINKAGFSRILLTLKKLFKHIRPKKLRAELEFGTGDPCSTGQTLGALAIFYGYYGESIQIIPNFDTAMFAGTLFCKGRIRIFTLLIISIKLIINKQFRQLLNNMKAFKEDL